MVYGWHNGEPQDRQVVYFRIAAVSQPILQRRALILYQNRIWIISPGKPVCSDLPLTGHGGGASSTATSPALRHGKG